MPTERQRLLAHRAHANAQRRARDSLLARAPPSVVERLARAECIFSPEADARLRGVLPFGTARVGVTPSETLVHYRFVRTGLPSRVEAVLNNAAAIRELEPALLVLSGVDEIRYGDVTELVPRLPVFRLPLGEALRTLAALWLPLADFAAAFAEDRSAGVLVDSFSEYPDAELSPDECTYEIASWGLHD
jgi:hypothetical protein